ncbi:MAG TPA: hypothetical protein VF624_08470 [Tepidisphaeraceae bacterium]
MTPAATSSVTSAVTPAALEAELRRLGATAERMGDDSLREIWRAALQNKFYELWFYPRGKKSMVARLGAGTAAGDFSNLQLLQDRKVPAVRAVALLAGFRFGDRTGDALLIDPGQGARRLDEWLFRGDPPADAVRRGLLTGIVEVLRKLGSEKLGHDRLSPAAFVVTDAGVRLRDPNGITREGLTEAQLWRMAHAFSNVASTADRVRVFRQLSPEARLPLRDPRGSRRFREDRQADAVERISVDGWSGRFRRSAQRPVAWSVASRLTIDAAEWQREWPAVVARMAAGQVEILKSDASGDVLGTEVRLAGRPVDVVLKRPLNKFFYRRLLAVTRVSRAVRMWEKTVALHLRHLPVEYPLIVMERRRLGYVVESIAVFERVPGQTLAAADLDAMTTAERARFFFRCGRTLRLIEQTGLAHPDAKSVNWIVYRHPGGPPTPVMLDAYGVRNLTALLQLRGLQRLLRAMREHPRYTPADSLEICLGFAPRAAPLPEGDA